MYPSYPPPPPQKYKHHLEFFIPPKKFISLVTINKVCIIFYEKLKPLIFSIVGGTSHRSLKGENPKSYFRWGFSDPGARFMEGRMWWIIYCFESIKVIPLYNV